MQPAPSAQTGSTRAHGGCIASALHRHSIGACGQPSCGTCGPEHPWGIEPRPRYRIVCMLTECAVRATQWRGEQRNTTRPLATLASARAAGPTVAARRRSELRQLEQRSPSSRNASRGTCPSCPQQQDVLEGVPHDKHRTCHGVGACEALRRARLASASGMGVGVAAAVAEMAGGSVFGCCRSMWACATCAVRQQGSGRGQWQCVRARARTARERGRAGRRSGCCCRRNGGRVRVRVLQEHVGMCDMCAVRQQGRGRAGNACVQRWGESANAQRQPARGQA